jgi:hypothetical protein
VGNIVYAPLVIQNVGGQLSASVVGTPTVVISIAGRLSHSPTPLCAANGDVLGMWFASRVGNDSDMYFTPSIKSPTPSPEFDNLINWVNNGAVAGGRFLAASNVADGYYGRMLEGQGYYAAVNSDIQVGPAAQMTIKVGAQSDPNLPLTSSAFALALGPINPVPIPGILGSFGLNPTPMFFPVPPGVASVTTDDFGEMQLPANAPSLKGNTVYFQALTSPIPPMPVAFTNTIKVRFL